MVCTLPISKFGIFSINIVRTMILAELFFNPIKKKAPAAKYIEGISGTIKHIIPAMR